MSRRRDDMALEIADAEGLAVSEESIELAAVGRQVIDIEYVPEGVLHHADLRSDRQCSAELLLQVWRAAQVIGVNVSFEDPVDVQFIRVHVVDDRVCGSRRESPRCGIEVTHGIDDRGPARRGVADDVGHGKRGLVMEGLDVRLGHFAGILATKTFIL